MFSGLTLETTVRDSTIVSLECESKRASDVNASTRAHTNGRTRERECEMSMHKRAREIAYACVWERERADLRREHTRTVERVALGEGRQRGKKEKVVTDSRRRSVSKTRDEKGKKEKKTPEKSKAKK
jgi:hypothetical protein